MPCTGSTSTLEQHALSPLFPIRSGEYGKALESLSAAAESDGSRKTSNTQIAYFQAMAESQLDRHDEATTSLARANELADEEINNTGDPPAWNRTLTLQLLRTEAETLIGKPAAPPKAESPDSAPTLQSSGN